MDGELKMHNAALKACKAYGKEVSFPCPVCGKRAKARKLAVGFMEIRCLGCNISRTETL